MNRIILMISILCFSCESKQVAIDPGVSWELAQHRKQTISNIRYEIELDIPGDMNKPIHGSETIRFQLSKTDQDVVLDFRQPSNYIHNVMMQGEAVDYQAESEHIVIPAQHFKTGENEVTIQFRAGDMSLNRNEEFLYTLFVPDRAATAIPCFDQPNLKGKYTLTLHTPLDWNALANGPLIKEEKSKNSRTFYFGETKPVSTYILAFATGKFDIITQSRNGYEMTMFHRETDSSKVARNADAIFDLHGDALEWMENYTGIKYTFQKFDFALIPGFQYGGMEHPGAIFYKDASLFLESSATKSQYLSRAGLIAHETAHMWFGDLVTMNWFDDVWTKEVFAGFMGGKIVNPAFPEINHDLRFLSNYASAYGVDRSQGANQIRQPLENLNMAGTLYGSIIYAKAPVVMKHLELMVGEETFQKGMQTYLSTYAFENATWPDLIKILDDLSEEDLTSWSQVWVDEPDRPTIEMDIKIDENGRILKFDLEQSDPKKKNRKWMQHFNLRLGYDEGDNIHPVFMNKRRVTVHDVKGLPLPNYILPNGKGVGYGYFKMDDASRSYLLANLPQIKDPMVRGTAWLNIWDDMLYGHAIPSQVIELGLKALESENDILNIQRILGRINSAYWSYLTQEQRIGLAEKLEKSYQSHLDRAESISLKSTFFRSLRSIALTDSSYTWLKRVWAKEESISGLPLSERDYIALASELALRGKSDNQAILNSQLDRINNPDRKARFAFIMPALSNEENVRDEFFESIKKEENRAREPWVQSAVGYLNHPIRAVSAEKYILPSLELLEEIQRTGDIFFPARFISATLGGHQSENAVQIVNSFLDDRPDYSSQLKLKILQAADVLYRSANILNQ